MKRFSFIDENLAHSFVTEKISEFLKKEKSQSQNVEYSFFTTPGIVDSQYDAETKIKDGAFILSGTLYFLSFYTKDNKNKQIPFALVYRDDLNYSIVFLFIKNS
jgi:hypothetical protein